MSVPLFLPLAEIKHSSSPNLLKRTYLSQFLYPNSLSEEEEGREPNSLTNLGISSESAAPLDSAFTTTVLWHIKQILPLRFHNEAPMGNI